MFRNLSMYTIELSDDTKYANSCSVSTKLKRATIYPFDGCAEEYENYLFHEYLHIAIADLLDDYSKEKEELLVQDIVEFKSK